MWYDMQWIYPIFLLFLALSASAQTEYSLCADQSGKQYSLAVILPLTEDCYVKSTSMTENADRARTAVGELSGDDVNLILLDSCNKEEILLKHLTTLLPYNSILPSLENQVPDDLGVCQSNFTNRLLGVITTHHISEQSDVQPVISSPWSNYPIISLFNGIRPVTNQPIVYQMTPENTGDILLDIAEKLNWDIMIVVYSESYYKYSSSVIASLALDRFICIQEEIVISQNNVSNLWPRSDLPQGILYIGEEELGISLLRMSGANTHTFIMQTSNETELGQIPEGTKVIAVKPAQSTANDLEDSIRFLYHCAVVNGCADQTASLLSRLNRTDGQQIRFAERQLRYDNTNARMYTIYKGQSTLGFSEIGHVTQSNIIINNTDLGSFRSLCTGDICSSTCRYVNNRQYIYIPGELNFMMTLPIQSGQSSDNVWQCSGWSNFENMARTLAVESVISMLNSRDDSPVEYGIVILDSCFNPLKTSTNTTAILSKLSKICTSNGTKCFDPKTVIAILSDYSSGVALAVQQTAMHIPVIQVAYGASSPIFDDEEVYKYFLRTTPSDARQAKHIATLCKLIGQSQSQNGGTTVYSVNLFYTSTPYGQGGKIIREYLIKNNITVARENLLEDYVGKSQEFFEKLSKPPAGETDLVRLSIVFGENEMILNHLDWLNGTQGTPSRIREEWLKTGNIFVFGDTWGNSEEFIQEYGHLVRGSFSFSFGTNFSVQPAVIDGYFRRPLAPSHENPWFTPFVQSQSQCKIRGDFSNSMNAEGAVDVELCTDKLSSQIFNQSAVQFSETFLSHSVKAVLAVVNAIENNDECPPKGTAQSCINKDINELFNAVLDSKLGPSTASWNSRNGQRVFNNEGNGAVGFNVHQIIYATNEFKNVRYHEPFYFDIADNLIQGTSMDFYNYNEGRDERAVQFQSGSPKDDPPVPPVDTPAPPAFNSLLLGISVGLGVLVVVIAVGCGIYIFKRRREGGRREGIYDTPQAADITGPRDSNYQVPMGHDNMALYNTSQSSESSGSKFPSPPAQTGLYNYDNSTNYQP